MQYIQPYGAAPGAVYVNGDPSIGRQGSIPPAAVMEYPQKEIIAVIQYAYDHALRDFDGVLCEAPSGAHLDQLLKAIYGLSNRRTVETPFTFYVSGSTGSNSNDGLTVGTPFLTIQKAVDVAAQYAPGPNAITIQLADYSNYAGAVIPSYSIPPIVINGHVGSSASVVIDGGVAAGVYCGSYNTLTVQNFKVQATGGTVVGAGSSGIACAQYGTVYIGSGMIFGTCSMACLFSSGVINVNANITSTGAGGTAFLYAGGGGINISSKTITYSNFTAVAAWAVCIGTGSSIGSRLCTWTGGTPSGSRYSANYNGWIDTNGSGSTYFPGSSAGSVANGGIYS